MSKQRIILDPTIPNRGGFSYWLNDHNLTGNAVEVGVWRGDFSLGLLENWNGQCMYLVDPWEKLPDEEYEDIRNRDFDISDYYHVLRESKRFGERCVLLRSKSQEALHVIPYDVSFDFVYIDANHDYDHVVADLRGWWGRLSKRAVLAGHDILSVKHPSVTQAVLEFATSIDAVVHVVDGDYDEHCMMHNDPSFYILKGF